MLREPVPSHALAPPNAFVSRDLLFESPSLHGRSAFSLSRFARLIARLSLKIGPRFNAGLSRDVRASPAKDERTACRPFGTFFYLPSGNPSAKALGYFRI